MFNLSVILGSWARPPSNRSMGAIHLDLERFSIRRGERVAQLTPSRFQITAAIIAARGGVVTASEIIDHAWGLREDGGPLTAQRAITVAVCIVRRQIASLGLEIKNVHSLGYRAECVGVVAASDPVLRVSPAIPDASLPIAA